MTTLNNQYRSPKQRNVSISRKRKLHMYSLAVAHARGDSHIKRTKTVLVAFRLLSLKRSTAEPFPIPLRVYTTNMTRDMCYVRTYLSEELIHFKPLPQHKISVLHRVFFKDFWQALLYFLYGNCIPEPMLFSLKPAKLVVLEVLLMFFFPLFCFPLRLCVLIYTLVIWKFIVLFSLNSY